MSILDDCEFNPNFDVWITKLGKDADWLARLGEDMECMFEKAWTSALEGKTNEEILADIEEIKQEYEL